MRGLLPATVDLPMNLVDEGLMTFMLVLRIISRAGSDFTTSSLELHNMASEPVRQLKVWLWLFFDELKCRRSKKRRAILTLRQLANGAGARGNGGGSEA